MFIFLTYLAMPELMAVPKDGPARLASGLDGERTFLMRVLGLTDEPRWTGGFGNPQVQDMVMASARRHRRYPGMTQDQLDFMAMIIALAPLRVSAALTMSVDDEDRAGYWRYMRQVMAPFCSVLPEEDQASDHCARQIARGAGASRNGAVLLRQLGETHPSHLINAIPVLFPGSAAIVATMMESHDDEHHS
jgi:hypothetical protein